VKYVALAFALAACGESSSGQPDAPRAIDAGADAMVNTTTSLTATMAATRTLTLGFYGVNADDGTLHVEVNLGGYTSCPVMSSPSPKYLVILGRVPAATSPTAMSPGNFLDYEGDMLPSPMLGQQATSVALTAVEYQVGSFVALDVSLTFPAGTVTGHIYATHCDSLDG
jgi:hypothetical protein